MTGQKERRRENKSIRKVASKPEIREPPNSVALHREEHLHTSAPSQPGVAAGRGWREGAVMTRSTAARITAAARTVRSVIDSLASSHPRNRATTGLTNA